MKDSYAVEYLMRPKANSKQGEDRMISSNSKQIRDEGRRLNVKLKLMREK